MRAWNESTNHNENGGKDNTEYYFYVKIEIKYDVDDLDSNTKIYDFLNWQWFQNTQEELLTEEGSIQITMASHHDLQVPLKISKFLKVFVNVMMRHYWSSLWRFTRSNVFSMTKANVAE